METKKNEILSSLVYNKSSPNRLIINFHLFFASRSAFVGNQQRTHVLHSLLLFFFISLFMFFFFLCFHTFFMLLEQILQNSSYYFKTAIDIDILMSRKRFIEKIKRRQKKIRKSLVWIAGFSFISNFLYFTVFF
jgi:hypothetical protein